MYLNNTRHFKLSVIILLWLWSIATYAQTEDRGKLIILKDDTLKKYNLFQNMHEHETFFFKNMFPTHSLERFRINTTAFQTIKIFKPFGVFSFNQSKTESVLNGLGSSQHFNNHFIFEKKKFTMEIESGLVSQNTLLMNTPVYQISFGTLIKYSVTDWLDAYLYGQYLTNPLNRSKEFFDPFFYNNPLFLQTELGGGLKTNIKKVNADFKVFSIYRGESNTFSPMNSVIRIEF